MAKKYCLPRLRDWGVGGNTTDLVWGTFALLHRGPVKRAIMVIDDKLCSRKLQPWVKKFDQHFLWSVLFFC